MIGESYIEADGKRYGLSYTMLQHENMTNMFSQKEGTLSSAVCLYFTAYEMNCRKNKIAAELSYEDMEVIIDEIFTNDEPQMKRLNDEYLASHAYEKMLSQVPDDKKKEVKTLASILLERSQPARLE